MDYLWSITSLVSICYTKMDKSNLFFLFLGIQLHEDTINIKIFKLLHKIAKCDRENGYCTKIYSFFSYLNEMTLKKFKFKNYLYQ